MTKFYSLINLSNTDKEGKKMLALNYCFSHRPKNKVFSKCQPQSPADKKMSIKKCFLGSKWVKPHANH